MMQLSQRIRWTCFAVAVQAIACAPALAIDLTYGETAAAETEYLSLNLAGRSIGSAKEQETVSYLTQRLTEFGLTPTLQPFTYEFQGQSLTSYNIVAETSGSSGQQIIVGAHYDTAPSSATLDRTNLQGTNDNSSGVGVLLELAERISRMETTNTIKFILFGAEEIGLIGSEYYASTLSSGEIDDTLLMINLDSLVVGDKMYFNAGRNAADDPALGVYRDRALAIADRLGIAAETNPGLNPNYPAGTGCCSDLEAFDSIVPVLAAEATNWEIGDLDGYTQTSNPAVPGGATWHDPATDNLEFINAVFPGLIEERTRNYTAILDTLLVELDAEAVSVPEPMSVLGMTLAIGLGGLVTRRQKQR